MPAPFILEGSEGPRVQSELLIESLFFILIPFKYKGINRTHKQTSELRFCFREFYNAGRVRLQPAWSTPTSLCQALLKQNNDQIHIAMIDPHHHSCHQF